MPVQNNSPGGKEGSTAYNIHVARLSHPVRDAAVARMTSTRVASPGRSSAHPLRGDVSQSPADTTLGQSDPCSLEAKSTIKACVHSAETRPYRKHVRDEVRSQGNLHVLIEKNEKGNSFVPDEEDLFMVSDLLLGGDLRYHIQQEVVFSEESIVLFVAEIALALDYLQSHKIVHRDIKPDNILLDEEGHAHVTDFNIATVLEDGELATSMSGTKPYIAPEIYMCSCEEYGVLGYGFAVDWWSLGILAWETLAGERPYPLCSTTTHREALQILRKERPTPAGWSSTICELLDRLLTVSPGARISTLKELKQVSAMRELDFDKVLNKQIKPPFTPPKDHLNCDPTFELEEMIIETKPLHKKKKRLAKQRSVKVDHPPEDTAVGLAEGAAGPSVDLRRLAFIPEYRVYNREREMERQEREKKEKQWEEDLNTAMKGAEERLKTKQQPVQRTGNRLSVSTTSVKTRISASPRQGRRASTVTSSDIDYIDASPEPSTS
ncbi:Serine/threonine-protein kinase 32B [Melipona quadrifasciata]|uniref:Serine/threonine-protein kinase 32B n=1 Tax=Melipona quadrifasciata TaxID=166423 RepID=A0A0M8ZTF3_9HYME|nr:Serine/threonine-protein kinase 32B [Melipona quadrifasciata]